MWSKTAKFLKNIYKKKKNGSKGNKEKKEEVKFTPAAQAQIGE